MNWFPIVNLFLKYLFLWITCNDNTDYVNVIIYWSYFYKTWPLLVHSSSTISEKKSNPCNLFSMPWAEWENYTEWNRTCHLCLLCSSNPLCGNAILSAHMCDPEKQVHGTQPCTSTISLLEPASHLIIPAGCVQTLKHCCIPITSVTMLCQCSAYHPSKSIGEFIAI